MFANVHYHVNQQADNGCKGKCFLFIKLCARIENISHHLRKLFTNVDLPDPDGPEIKTISFPPDLLLSAAVCNSCNTLLLAGKSNILLSMFIWQVIIIF